VPARAKPGGAAERKMEAFDKTIFKNIMKDEGYFSSLDPMKRVAVAEKTFDVGEYLLRLRHTGKLETKFGPVQGQAVYFPPCHQREQEFGQPYLELLGLIPDLELEAIQGNLFCCGLAGVMGFKRDFHQASIKLGSRLIEKIREMNPERIVTDCLSCRLQFSQLLPYPVLHPIEVLKESYHAAARDNRLKAQR